MNFLKTRFRFFGANSTRAFSLVEILVALIIISLILGALMPIITKKLKSSAITIAGGGGGGFGGVSSCPSGLYVNMEAKTCEVCPAGNYCDGVNKIPCDPGTFSLNKASECTPCPDNYYAPEGASECLENTAQNCVEKSKTENACISCSADDVLADDGNCVLGVPVYTFMNTNGANVTATETESTKDDNYWTIKIKSSGTLTFTSLPARLIDVFVVGGGGSGRAYVGSTCGLSTVPGGGGNFNILTNFIVSTETAYPITIGSGGSPRYCGMSNGNASSAFGAISQGGVGTADHSICPFNEPSCTLKYGQTGSGSNQIGNTGNGGAPGGYTGMSGVVILRGRIGAQNSQNLSIPSYTFSNSSGSDITNASTSLSATNTHWYLKIAASGNLKFDSIKNDKIDVFVVGGGESGRAYVGSTCGLSAIAGGGGNFNVSTDIAVAAGIAYPIVIGSGGSPRYCGISGGNASSAFEVSAAGGSGTVSHKVCLFNSTTDCTVTYGNVGSASNQNPNTGNGGAAGGSSGMSGVVIIRGTL